MGIQWGAGQPRRRTSGANWRQPLRWNAQAAKTGERWLVFCSSLADVFDNEVPPEWRMDLFTLIAKTPHLTWLLLTKRIGNVASMATGDGLMFEMLATRVWLGITVVNQDEADRDIPKLLAVPAAKRFVSYEPALGPVDFVSACNQECPHESGYMEPDTGAWICNECENTTEMPGLDWIIVGGESDQPGMRARPFDIAWARSTVEQCRAAGVPVFMKQAGSFVVDRNDAGFDGCDPYSWPDGTDDKVIHDPFGIVERWQGATIRVKLNDRAGADPAEWPEDLRVREFA